MIVLSKTIFIMSLTLGFVILFAGFPDANSQSTSISPSSPYAQFDLARKNNMPVLVGLFSPT